MSSDDIFTPSARAWTVCLLYLRHTLRLSTIVFFEITWWSKGRGHTSDVWVRIQPVVTRWPWGSTCVWHTHLIGKLWSDHSQRTQSISGPTGITWMICNINHNKRFLVKDGISVDMHEIKTRSKRKKKKRHVMAGRPHDEVFSYFLSPASLRSDLRTGLDTCPGPGHGSS